MSPRGESVFEFEPLSVNLRWPMKTVQEEEEKGSASLCLSSTERPPWVLRDTAGSQKSLCVSELPQLFSKSDRRSSLLLLGRSGGSRYDNSSSGFASSGRSCKERKRKMS